jgi:uncharacterized protein (UPF0548 family)
VTQESVLTYSEVGGTRDARPLPRGFHAMSERRQVGSADVLDRAGDVVLAFGMQRGAGVRVSSSEPLARAGLDVHLEVALGPLRLQAPTRVVYVVSEPDRRGFAYGTLEGHPERGEELFLVERVGGATFAEVRAFSRPGRWFTRLGGPVGRVLQRRFARRYLDALERELTAGEKGS